MVSRRNDVIISCDESTSDAKNGRNHNPKWHTPKRSTVWIFTASRTNRTQAWRSSDWIEKKDEREKKRYAWSSNLRVDRALVSCIQLASPYHQQSAAVRQKSQIKSAHAFVRATKMHSSISQQIAAGNFHKVQNIHASWISHLMRHLLHFCNDTTQKLMLNLLAILPWRW